jgi:tetratricopeptide (TPR) repeat protein
VGWRVRRQKFTWRSLTVMAPADRSRKLPLGNTGFLVFKSVQDARACKVEPSPGRDGAGKGFITLEPSAVGKSVRLLFPLTILSDLEGVPPGASATFAVSFHIEGSGNAKPLEWIALLSEGADQDLHFWRKIAENVDLGKPGARHWLFSIEAGTEIPNTVHLAVQLKPGSGSVTLGDVRIGLESIVTKRAALDAEPKAPLKGWFRSPYDGTAVWLHACIGATPVIGLRVGPETDLFKLEPKGGRVNFSVARESLMPILGGGTHAWRLVLTENHEAVAQVMLRGGHQGTPSERGPTLTDLSLVDDQTLANKLREIRNVELLSRARVHFKERNWAGLLQFHRVLIGVSKEYQRLLLMVGRAALYTNDYHIATKLLGLGAATFPTDEEMQYYCGVALTRSGRHADSISYLRAALQLLPSAIRTKKALAIALRRAARDADSPQKRIDMISDAAQLLKEVLDEEFSRGSAVSLAEALSELGRNEEALKMVDLLFQNGERDVAILLLRARSLVALTRVSEALAIAEEVIKVDPLNQAARFYLRALRFLGDGDAATGPPTFGELVRVSSGSLVSGALGEAKLPLQPEPTNSTELAAALSRLPFDWLRIADGEASEVTIADLERGIDSSAGFCVLDRAGQAPTKLWRREALVHLAESGLITSDLADLPSFEDVYCRYRASLVADNATAVVLSRHGSLKFGGGEHFIESMAEHYRSVGYDPIIVGTRRELVGKSGVNNGFRFDFVDHSAASLRRLFLQSKAQLVHGISGVGFEVTEALSYTNIPFIYGVHFWREALGDASDKGYFDGEGKPVARPEFQYVLSRASSVYANSQYTRSVLEKAFGVRCPVIYSVPREVEHHDT